MIVNASNNTMLEGKFRCICLMTSFPKVILLVIVKDIVVVETKEQWGFRSPTPKTSVARKT